MSAPMSQIYLAYLGKIDFVKKTNPFGAGESEAEKAQKEQKAAENKAKNEARALKFDMLVKKARQNGNSN